VASPVVSSRSRRAFRDLGQPDAAGGDRRRTADVEQRLDVGGVAVQGGIDLGIQVAAGLRIEEHARGGKNGGHHGDEGDGEPDADREARQHAATADHGRL
jgi:hypothetical protein